MTVLGRTGQNISRLGHFDLTQPVPHYDPSFVSIIEQG
jgi:hypothetical protein